jgi:pimeloyl-ACP methyl ester carboxylesterase
MEPPPTSVVLLHGFGSTFDHNWRQTGWVDILGDFGCVAPDFDLPAHGTSVRSTDPASYAAVDEEVAVRIPPSTAAVGFSAGAEILLRIAVAHPGTFPRLVLLGLGDNLFETSDSRALVDALEGGGAPEDIQARVFTRLAETTGNDPSALAAFLQRPRRPVREEDLAAVTCPVLVVLGDQDFVGTADRLVGALPSATLVAVPGVDHFATPSDFRVIDATMKFLGLD